MTELTTIKYAISIVLVLAMVHWDPQPVKAQMNWSKLDSHSSLNSILKRVDHRRKVPSQADVKKSFEQYESLIRHATKNDDPDKVFDGLFSLASRHESESRASLHFGLNQEALNHALDRGQWAQAWKALRRISWYYDYELEFKSREKIIGELLKNDRTKKVVYQFFDLMRTKIDLQVDFDDYDSAWEGIERLEAVTKRRITKELKAELAALKEEVARHEEAYESIQPALQKLAENPTDEGANLEVGYHYFFEKKRFKSGAALLARGPQDELTPIFQKISSSTENNSDWAKISLGWWKDYQDKKLPEEAVDGVLYGFKCALRYSQSSEDIISIVDILNEHYEDQLEQFSALTKKPFQVVWEDTYRSPPWTFELKSDGRAKVLTSSGKAIESTFWVVCDESLYVRGNDRLLRIFPSRDEFLTSVYYVPTMLDSTIGMVIKK